VGYGPFVMNSRQEIEAAVSDFQRGKFGSMPAPQSEGAAAGA
jgi:quercetin 2,3-dioxygenase